MTVAPEVFLVLFTVVLAGLQQVFIGLDTTYLFTGLSLLDIMIYYEFVMITIDFLHELAYGD